jgi:hypothetical protein
MTFKKLIKKIDDNILLILSVFLLILIPLYPKLPLFDIIEGYIVRVRIEDFFVAVTALVFFIQLLRKKVSLKTPISWAVGAYILVGFTSTLSGIFLTQTIPTSQVHILKSFLHFFRYIEYFSLFFIVYASIKTIKDFQVLIGTMFTTLLGVGLYGLGQKYLFWPVYSTMNREFSKGITLYLTEHARVQSTFGGHYDLAAYLVITLPIIFLFLFLIKNRLFRFVGWISFIIGVWMVILSASRVSLAGFLIGMFLAILIASLLEKKWSKKISFFVSKSLIMIIIFGSLFLSFGESISGRLLQSAKGYQTLSNAIEYLKQGKDNVLSSLKDNQNVSDALDRMSFQVEKPKNGISVDQAEVLVASDTRPSPIKPGDVFVDIPDRVEIATISATGEITTIVIEVPRTYSDAALRHGLSLAIRLDTLWPRAIEGFYTNPILGSGYATLTKESVEQFTEAESTDNNYLRTLGETGLLGFITFYAVVLIPVWIAFKIITDKKENIMEKKYFAVGFVAATVGLLVNAVFIDVFAASKVAFTFWAVAGMMVAIKKIKPEPQTINKSFRKIKKIKKRKKGKFANLG